KNNILKIIKVKIYAIIEGKSRKDYVGNKKILPFIPFLKHSKKRTYYVLQNRLFYLLLTENK
ncbi:MAG: hypothetical protein ABFD50_05700, partial [Smithella sp.]